MTKENYMALADVQSLWDDSLKPWIRGNFEYEDVYVGAAAASSTVIASAYHHDTITIGKPIAISNASGYLWVIMPSTYSPVVMMGGIEVPMALDGTTTISSQSYKIWKSNNSYTGTFNIALV